MPSSTPRKDAPVAPQTTPVQRMQEPPSWKVETVENYADGLAEAQEGTLHENSQQETAPRATPRATSKTTPHVECVVTAIEQAMLDVAPEAAPVG